MRRGWPENSQSYLILVSVMLASCSVRDGAPERYGRDWQMIENAVPLDEPFSRYGNPDSYEVFGRQYHVMESNSGFSEQGFASWYGTKFHGQRTSSGETYDMYEMTAAHKSLRIPSYVEVTNLNNSRKAIVKVNDRGPFHDGRIIDLSYAAATRLGVAETGTAPVTIRVIEVGKQEAMSDTDESAENVVDDPVTKRVVANNSSATNAVELPVEKLLSDQVYVQIAAFVSETNAIQMMNDLKKKKFNRVRIHVEGAKDKLYRVRIGPVPTTSVAEKLVIQLKEMNYNNVRIVAL